MSAEYMLNEAIFLEAAGVYERGKPAAAFWTPRQALRQPNLTLLREMIDGFREFPAAGFDHISNS
jgi:hypothetical protein